MISSCTSDSRRRQRGVAAVEFALGSLLFFTFVFGVIELARALYVYSTMVEVTRRAAAIGTDADVDLDDHKKLPKKIAAVIDELEEADLLEDDD